MDTSFLIDAVAGRREDIPYQKRELYRIRRMRMDVTIPQIIIGETFAVITRKFSNDDLKDKIFDLVELIKTLVSDTDHCIPPVSQETIDMAKEIIAGDSYVKWTDALLVSHALVDRNARYIITRDRVIHESKIIRAKMREREEDWSKLNLIDSVP